MDITQVSSGNFTASFNQFISWDQSEYITKLFLNLVSVGLTISPECWLRFPMMVKFYIFIFTSLDG